MRYIYQGRVRDNFGNVVDEQSIYIYLNGTNTAVKIYENETGGSPIQTLPQISSDSNGFFEIWIDEADYAYTQFFDVVVNSIRYKKLDIFNREKAVEVGYTPGDTGDWDADSDPDIPDNVKKALDELAETVKTIDGGEF